MNCWLVGGTLVLFLASFCLWNCLTREELADPTNWYGCRDHYGNPVDSFVVYKLPRDKNADFAPLRDGTAYMYLIPETVVSIYDEQGPKTNGWVLSNVTIDSPASMPGRTLHLLYNDHDINKIAAYIMYNDEFPNNTKSFTKGHTKGVVFMTSHGGFWLVHSVPKYPPVPEDGYGYPSSGHHYGQSMLCISLPPDQGDKLGHQLNMNNPFMYATNMPDALQDMYGVLAKVMSHDLPHPHAGPWYDISMLKSVRGRTFTSFAKYTKFNHDLYSDLVAPVLRTSLAVESWQNGPGKLSSSCNASLRVMNVESVAAGAAGSTFSSHRDHSKWAVAVEPDQPYVCIGDINRMETQFHRAGGTVCMWGIFIWQRFHRLVQDVEVCPSTI